MVAHLEGRIEELKLHTECEIRIQLI